MGIADAATLAWLISEGREDEYHSMRHGVAMRTIARVRRQTDQAAYRNPFQLAAARFLGPMALKLGIINDIAASFVMGLSDPPPPWLAQGEPRVDATP